MHTPTFATRANLDVLEENYRRWLADPGSLDPQWQAFFEGFSLSPQGDSRVSEAQTSVARMIMAYRELGHLIADLDPLRPPPQSHEQLEPAYFHLNASDLDQTFDGSAFFGLGATTLRNVIQTCRETYCRTIGFEFMHIQDLTVRRWLRDRIEPNRGRPNFSVDQKVRILRSLLYAEMFEDFLQSRYQGQKRFSLEGAEALIPLLDSVVQKAPSMGVKEFVIGMAHRGRLNVLANILGKPYEWIFAEFEEHFEDTHGDGAGDVKYHLGYSNTLDVHGHPIHLSLTPNPSHLESVNSVVEGRVRAKQEMFGDSERRFGVPLLIHGDAALPGQGQVAETLNMAGLEGYTTGGTLHVVINNQIGFTTAPGDGRSTRYCTDVAKLISAPIFHVNADDAEAVAFVAELALEYRQTFNQDVVIDLICYRKYGHNEGDEPTFSNPLMYQRIKQKPAPSTIYAERLVSDGVISSDERADMYQQFADKLDKAQKNLHASPRRRRGMPHFDSPRWKDFTFHYSHDVVETGVPYENLRLIADAYTNLPPDFKMHERLRSTVIEKWQDSVRKRDTVEWGLAESLAFGSLVMDGTPVRLSGQDCRRGTFSHRHSAYVDVETGKRFLPLNHIRSGQARFQVWDSPLSEYSVVGFEYGYSLDDPKTLTIWEAQFGDFCNGAQVVIDQYIAAGESKWQRASGLVMLLPHGYEGQGPEHSSARLERFLQLCADDNIQVVNCTTPAQYFHLLRRQMKRVFRKPLIVMAPKSLLRHPLARSPVDELTTGHFHEVLDDPRADPNAVRRVFLCSGKVYYDFLYDPKDKKPLTLPNDVALLRLEQFYPWPADRLRMALQKYPRAHRFVWLQEEPENMGGWSFVEPRLRSMGFRFEYVGRVESPSPATGSYRIHGREQKELIEVALADLVPYRVRAVPPASEKRPETNPRSAK